MARCLEVNGSLDRCLRAASFQLMGKYSRAVSKDAATQEFHLAVFNPMQHCYILIAGLEWLSCRSSNVLHFKGFQPDSIFGDGQLQSKVKSSR